MMNQIHWSISDLKDVPGENNWLSKREKLILENLRFLKRRQEWRLGRWTAKNALLLFNPTKQDLSLSDIEILPKVSGAPYLLLNKEDSTLSISISHREGKAVCIISKIEKSIGCDLEYIEPRSNEFIRDYFTDDEKIHLLQNDDGKYHILSNIIWSAKESVSKVLEVGLNMDTKDVNVSEIEIDENLDWKNFKIVVKKATPFFGKWKRMGDFILTIVLDEEFYSPIQL